MHVALIYPHQLFDAHPALSEGRTVWLIEDPLFFGDPHHPITHHALKLAYHRATMQRYRAETLAHYAVRVVEHGELKHAPLSLFALLREAGMTHLHVAEPADDLLTRRLLRGCAREGINITWYDTPNFLTTSAQITAYYTGKKTYHQTDFYVWQRKRLQLLLTPEGKPIGGKWTYDSENRHKLKPNVSLPQDPTPYHNAYIREAQAYVRAHFPHAYGDSTAFIYPTNHAEAQAVLNDFLAHKLQHYGTYQDAISPRGAFLFHSLLSAPLNVGLLSPSQVVQAALDYAQAHPQTPLASLEGFIRQVVGWREFMRAVYLREGVRQRNSNFWGQTRPLSPAWYEGTLGIPPVDDVIRKTRTYAYAHHIERLMLVGNLMLLAEVHPNDVYRWFMELFIDAYDWVMVPNVYGMSQHADGGIITTKPYISSSNYVRKMSDYKAGAWCDVWDSLYWRFVHKHQAFFKDNPRLSMMTGHLERMGEAGVRAHLARAEAWLEKL